ncbi:MAG: hypothetical protein Q7S28_03465 [bacterium]|nr:hypothetical protein [bacterium]
MINDKFIYYFIRFVIGIVSVAIIAGFFVAGSPTKQRMMKADQQRVNDLQSLQYAIINYWQAKQRLPVALADLNDPTRGVIVQKDPETGVDYEYSVTESLSFSLCAEFKTASDGTGDNMRLTKPMPAPMAVSEGSPLSDVWSHAEGRVCFDRKIDTDFYKPLTKQAVQ